MPEDSPQPEPGPATTQRAEGPAGGQLAGGQLAGDMLTQHAETGWRLGLECLERLEDGADLDPATLHLAIGHLMAAAIDGVDGIVIRDPDLLWLLGHLLLQDADQPEAAEVSQPDLAADETAAAAAAAEDAHVAFAEGLDCAGTDESIRLALLDGALLACRCRTGLLETGADPYHPEPELARARDLQATAAQGLYRAVPADHEEAGYAAAALIRALAARLMGPTGPEDDASRLMELLASRPDVRAVEGTVDAAGLVLLTGYALGRAFEHTGREELLLAAASFVAEARAWPELPTGTSAQLALMMASIILNAPEYGELAARLGEVEPLLDEADAGLPGDDPNRHQIDLSRTMLLQHLVTRGTDPADLTAAAQAIGRAQRVPGPEDSGRAGTLAGLLGGVLEARFRRRQDLRDVRTGLDLNERALAGVPGPALQRAVLLANRNVQLMQLAWMTGDRSLVASALESLREAIRLAPARSPVAAQLQALLAGGLIVQADRQPAAAQREAWQAAWAAVTLAAEAEPPWPQALVIQRTLALALGEADPQIRAAGERAGRRLQELSSRLARQGQQTGLLDLAGLLVDGIAAMGPAASSELMEAAIAGMDALPADPGHPQMARQMLGMQQARLLRRRDDLRWQQSLQEYQQTAGGDELPVRRAVDWLALGTGDTSGIGPLLARGLRERIRDSPDRRQSRQIGLRVLRGHAERVLLQSGTEDAIRIGRAAARDSHEVVTWCAADGADDEAITALETGRGLTLLAAGAAESVSGRLAAIGESTLARSWADSLAPGEPGGDDGLPVPDDIRHRVLDRLATSGDLADLLQPPDRAELAATVTRLGYDALVYLIPRGRTPDRLLDTDHPGGGFAGRTGGALLVTAAGQVHWQDLPELAVGPDTAIGGYLRAHRALLAPGSAPDQRQAWRAALEQACQWAWAAAMEPLQPLLGHIHAARRARVVLIPVDALCVIPWHAAYPAADHRLPPSERRYALDSVTYSYAASGALLARVGGRRPPDLGASVLLIGDPAGDLPWAGAETRALRAAFYPDAVTWGEPEALTDGAATPDRLRAALVGGGPTMVHYAGHATVDAGRPGSSALVMSRGEHLRAEGISKLAPDHGYFVCLAACTTHLAADAFDEVFTLSTAFLLGGASTVVGSLWRIKDAGTAALTFMLHHYLSRGQRPADALRRAQLWMLRPERRIPDSMPAAIRDALPFLDLTDPILWAGLTHQGH